MKGDVQLELSGLNLIWTNGKNTQTAVMMNPEDKLEGTVSEAKRIYVAEDSTAVYFLKKFPSPENQININRTIVSVCESKQSTTKCHPLD
jgi:ketosteroid isomerase-like protein